MSAPSRPSTLRFVSATLAQVVIVAVVKSDLAEEDEHWLCCKIIHPIDVDGMGEALVRLTEVTSLMKMHFD